MTAESIPAAPRSSAPVAMTKQPCVQRSLPRTDEAATPRLVFGYVRMEEPDEAKIAQLRDELGRFCLSQRFHLGGVFCDRGVPEDAIARTGFAGALDALRVPDSYALLVPSREHLSGDQVIERALVRMVNRTGSRVLCLPSSAGTAANTPVVVA